jgi:hypothetical protein
MLFSTKNPWIKDGKFKELKKNEIEQLTKEQQKNYMSAFTANAMHVFCKKEHNRYYPNR